MSYISQQKRSSSRMHRVPRSSTKAMRLTSSAMWSARRSPALFGRTNAPNSSHPKMVSAASNTTVSVLELFSHLRLTIPSNPLDSMSSQLAFIPSLPASSCFPINFPLSAESPSPLACYL